MKKTLKRCLSLLLAIAVILSSAYVGLGDVALSKLFAVKTEAANETKGFSEAMYIIQESVTCDGEITYVIYLKSGVSVSDAVFYVEFDEKAMNVCDGGAYTILDSYGDPAPKIPGMYESGLRWDSANVYAMTYVNTTPPVLTGDTPFMKITFKINEGYNVADIKFTCAEFLSRGCEFSVSRAEMPAVMFDENVDITISEHISGNWIQYEASVYSDGLKYRNCTVCGQTIERIVFPQLICEEPGLIGVIPDDEGLIFGWNSVRGADAYAVYRKTEETDWELLVEVSYDTTTYLDSNVEDGIVYFYTVGAINEAGESSYDTDGVFGEYHIHKFSPWETIIPATCTTTGRRSRACYCGEEEIINVAALGHKSSAEWIIDVQPTCTENGSKSHRCTVCGEKTDVTVIMATGHNYEIISAISAHPHTTSYKCSYCGGEKTENTVDPDCIECIFGSDLPIKGNENTEVDYDNLMIFTSVKNCDEITEILGFSDSAAVVADASHIYGNYELYGTGSIVTVFDGDYIAEFTLIVEGDLNGDSVCDVLDAASAQLYSVGLDEPSENEMLAANGCISDEINANSYQGVVNMMLAG